MEPSSKYEHAFVNVLGIYKENPFVTGTSSTPGHKKTEILDHTSKQWNEVKDYPFTSGDRYAFNSLLLN